MNFTRINGPAGSREFQYNSPQLTSTRGGEAGAPTCNNALYRILVRVENPGNSDQYRAEITRIGVCGPPLNGAILMNGTPPGTVVPPVVTPPPAEEDTSDAGADDNPCSKPSELGWVICPMNTMLMDAAEWMDTKLLDLLKIETGSIFDTNSGDANDRTSSQAFYKGWSIFRNLAYALLLILGLVMVISQIMGLDLFDAYTIRKMLPKMVAVAILIPLLWPLLAFVFNMANDSADAVGRIIKGPFENLGRAATGSDRFFEGATFPLILPLLLAGLGAIGVLGGLGVAFTLLLSALLAVGSAFFIIMARDIVAYGLIEASALAIVLGIFEPFKKGFIFWRRMLITILISIPAIAAVLAASKVGAAISFLVNDNGLGYFFALIFIVAGYFLFWSVFKQIDKVSGQLGNVVSNVTNGMQKGLSKYRSNTVKRRFGEAVAGERTFGPKGMGLGMNTVADLTSRFQNAGKVGGSLLGPSARAAKQADIFKAAAKAVEEDGKKGAGSGGNTDLMEAIVMAGPGASRSKIIQTLVDRWMKSGRYQPGQEGDAAKQAKSELATAETNFGLTAGTHEFTTAAAIATTKDNTAWREEKWRTGEEAQLAFRDGLSRLVDAGAMTLSTGASIMTTNKARLDIAGGGFGAAMQFIENGTKAGGGIEHEVYEQAVIRGNTMQALMAQRWEGARHASRVLRDNMEIVAAHAQLSMVESGEATMAEAFTPEEITGLSARYGISAAAPDFEAQLRARVSEDVRTRKLDEDNDEQPLTPRQAVSRAAAALDSAYAQMEHWAPQNRDWFADQVINQDVTLPMQVQIEVPQRRPDGSIVEDAAGAPVMTTQTVTRLMRMKTGEALTRLKSTDPEFERYGYQFYGTYSAGARSGPVDPAAAGVVPPGGPGAPPGGGPPGGAGAPPGGGP